MKESLGKQVLKWILWSLLSFIVVVLTGIGIVINFIFTPAKITNAKYKDLFIPSRKAKVTVHSLTCKNESGRYYMPDTNIDFIHNQMN